MCSSPKRSLALIFIVFYMCFNAPNLLADPIDDGIEALAIRDYPTALRHFTSAVSGPDGATAFFYLAVTYNRGGQALAALGSLERAAQMGINHPDLAFERGWAQLEAGRYSEAVEELLAYEQTVPGRGQTSELLGRAYLALGQYTQARAALEQALTRDPELEPTVRAVLISLARAKGVPEESAAKLELLLQAHPDGPLAEAMGMLPSVSASQGAASMARKKWRLELDASFGHNSNVITIGDGVPLLGDIPDQASVTGMGGRFVYDLIQAPGERLVAGYSGRVDRYKSELSGRNRSNHLISATYLRRPDEKTVLSVRSAGESTRLDRYGFRTRLALRPAAQRQVGARTSVQLSYQFNHISYDLSANLVTDRLPGLRSSRTTRLTSHGIGVELSTSLLQLSARLRAGYSLMFNNVEGAIDDGANEDGAHTLYAMAQAPLAYEVRLRAFYAYTTSEFSANNSFTGFSAQPEVAPHVLNLQATRPVAPGLNLRLVLSHLSDGSTIDVFDNGQSLILFGFQFRR